MPYSDGQSAHSSWLERRFEWRTNHIAATRAESAWHTRSSSFSGHLVRNSTNICIISLFSHFCRLPARASTTIIHGALQICRLLMAIAFDAERPWHHGTKKNELIEKLFRAITNRHNAHRQFTCTHFSIRLSGSSRIMGWGSTCTYCDVAASVLALRTFRGIEVVTADAEDLLAH